MADKVGPGHPPKEHQFKPGQSGNPAGAKKGAKHLSTWIQEMVNDEEFKTYLHHPTKGYIEFKGAPIKAIIQVAVQKAVGGDDKAREWLARHGYGLKVSLDTGDPVEEVLRKFGLLPEEDEDAQQTPRSES